MSKSPRNVNARLTASLLGRVNQSSWQHDIDLNQEHSHGHKGSILALFGLAFSSLGVVMGDLGTSPLYVLSTVFQHPPEHHEVLGVVSLILWTIISIVIVKYCLCVLHADDNNNGGAFALFSLLQRATRMRMSAQGPSLASDYRLTRYGVGRTDYGISAADDGGPDWRTKLGSSFMLRKVVVVMVVIGVGFVLGDGVITPAISVLSAVEGLKLAVPGVSQNVLVAITVVVLLGIFGIQRYGTHRVSGFFAPIIATWLSVNAGIGLYNILKYHPGVVAAISPHHFVHLLLRRPASNHKLSGVLLCVTGVEALFADLGHFSRQSIQLSCIGVLLPSLVLTYLGQGAYLMANPEGIVGGVFWAAQPPVLLWPMVALASVSSVVASQSLISAVFSIVSQSIRQSFFPKFRVVHTSRQVYGQVYVPVLNNVMLVLTVAVVLVFRASIKLGAAYGIAVVADMLITTALMSLVMLLVWRKRTAEVVAFAGVFGAIEGAFLTASFSKIFSGGFFTLMMAGIWGFLMWTWNWGSVKKSKYNSARVKHLRDIIRQEVCMTDEGMSERVTLAYGGEPVARYPGLGLFYSESADGVPPGLADYMLKVPALPRLVVIITVRRVFIPEVLPEERLLFQPLGVSGFYHCVARYGYMEDVDHGSNFVHSLVGGLADSLSRSVDFPSLQSPSQRSSLDVGAGHPVHTTISVHPRAMRHPISAGASSLHPPLSSSPPSAAPTATKAGPPPESAAAGGPNGAALELQPAPREPYIGAPSAGPNHSESGGDDDRSGSARSALWRTYSDSMRFDGEPFLHDEPELPYRGNVFGAGPAQGGGQGGSPGDDDQQELRMQALEHEVQLVVQQASKRLVYVFGKTHIKPRPGSSMLRCYMLQVPYQVLLNNFSTASYELFGAPLHAVMEVAQVCYI